MFTVNEDLSIYATRGDTVFFNVTAEEDGVPYVFQSGDVVRIKIYGKKDAETVVLQKDFPVTSDTEWVEILLTEEDTKIGEVISKPKDYWYEIELNPFTNPQTIIGYDDEGAKVFKLYPEGNDLSDVGEDITEEDIPVVDDDFSLTSARPLENRAISRRFVNLENTLTGKITQTNDALNDVVSDVTMLKARVNNLATAEPGDREIEDIRVDFNGNNYDNAGEAVRAVTKMLNDEVAKKQDILVDGKSIKTINGESILGSGDIVVSDEAVGGYVEEWLNAHPDATTTVQDGSIDEVKLSDDLKVKAIKDYVTPQMFGAVGDGKADDTDAIQNCINSGSSNIIFPKGTYLISKTLDFSKVFEALTQQYIKGDGAVIKAADTFDGAEMLLFSTNNIADPQKIVIEGITVYGNRTVNGMLLNFVQLFDIRDVSIQNCYTGMSICDVFYGNVGNNVELIGNVVAIRLYAGVRIKPNGIPNSENNTLRFDNVRISGIDKKYTTSDTIGIQIDSVLLGVSFNSVVIETVDYGILGFNVPQKMSGTIYSIFSIENCYFENIGIKSISLGRYYITDGIVTINEKSGTIYDSISRCLIKNCHFASGSGNINLGWGFWRFLNNDYSNTIYLWNNVDHECFFESDNYYKIELFTETAIRRTQIKQGAFGYTPKAHELKEKTIRQLEAFDRKQEINISSPEHSFLGRLYPMHSITTKDLVFQFGENGVIQKDLATGAYYMLSVVNGEVKPILVADKLISSPRKGMYNPFEVANMLYDLSEGDVIGVGMNNITYQLTVTADKTLVSSNLDSSGNTYVMIGTITDFINMVEAEGFVKPNNHGAMFYDVNVNRYYYIREGYYYGTRLGVEKTSSKAYGLLANRPSSPILLQTYYATDESIYYVYNGTEWVEM
jgi:hypothetical protein